jgi:cobalt-zinc-cadmium efflux system outer membrane protein
LRRWIGEAADEPLGDAAPPLLSTQKCCASICAAIRRLQPTKPRAMWREAGLRMARAERWPDWSWELSYGRRDPALEDMASVEVRVGLPLFQAWRQGPLIDARRSDVVRVGAEREATLREHEAMLEAGLRNTRHSRQAWRGRAMCGCRWRASAPKPRPAPSPRAMRAPVR